MGLPYGGFGRFLESMKTYEQCARSSYLEPTQVLLAEKAKVFGIIQLREFGNLAPYLW